MISRVDPGVFTSSKDTRVGCAGEVSEVYKVLFLISDQPIQYNVDYFADKFNEDYIIEQLI